MEYSQRDLQFLKTLKDKGYDFDKSISLLNEAKNRELLKKPIQQPIQGPQQIQQPIQNKEVGQVKPKNFTDFLKENAGTLLDPTMSTTQKFATIGGKTIKPIDTAGNLYKGVENAIADTTNIVGDIAGQNWNVKPLREVLLPTGEQYEGGLLQKSADEVVKTSKKMLNRNEEYVERGDIADTVLNPTRINTDKPFGTLKGNASAISYFGGQTGELALGISQVFGQIFNSALGTTISDKTKQEFANTISEVAENKGVQQAYKELEKAQGYLEQYKESQPQMYDIGYGLLNTGFFALDMMGGKSVKTLSENIGEQTKEELGKNLKKEILDKLNILEERKKQENTNVPTTQTTPPTPSFGPVKNDFIDNIKQGPVIKTPGPDVSPVEAKKSIIDRIRQGYSGLKERVEQEGFEFKGVVGEEPIIRPITPEKGILQSTKEQITTGLTKEQIKGFQSNPYQSDEYRKLTERMESPEGLIDVKDYKTERVGAITKELTDEIDKIREEKGETGKIYQDVREQEVEIKLDDMLVDLKNTLEKNGIKYVEETGEIIRIPGSKAKDLNQADINKFNQIFNDILADNQKGYLTPTEILTFRKTISNLSKYDASTTTTGQGVMRAIRKDIDNTAKKQIPGLKELDQQFVDKLEEYENAIKDLVYKQGDVKGEWRSNIVNIIGTLDRQNRAKLLERLEEVIPGIGERIKAIDNIPTIYNSLQNKGFLGRFSGVGGAVAGAGALSGIPVIGQIVGGALGYAGGEILGQAITGFKKKALDKVLKNMSDQGLRKLEDINNKIIKKEKLSQDDKDFINGLKKDFENETNKNNTDNVSSNSDNKSMTNSSSNTDSNNTGKSKIKTPGTKTNKKTEIKENKQETKQTENTKKTEVKKTEETKQTENTKKGPIKTPDTGNKVVEKTEEKKVDIQKEIEKKEDIKTPEKEKTSKFTPEEKKEIGNNLQQLAGLQDVKAMEDDIRDGIMTKEQSLEMKKEIIDNLVEKDILKKGEIDDKGQSYQFTDLAKEEFNIGGKNSGLPFLKDGVHIPVEKEKTPIKTPDNISKIDNNTVDENNKGVTNLIDNTKQNGKENNDTTDTKKEGNEGGKKGSEGDIPTGTRSTEENSSSLILDKEKTSNIKTPDTKKETEKKEIEKKEDIKVIKTPDTGKDTELEEINKKLDKKSRKEINEEVGTILYNKGYSKKAEDYSKEEIETLKRYTGVGGLKQESETGVGALSEFYTPKNIIKKLWLLAQRYGIRKGKVFEPSAGLGRVLNEAPKGYNLSGIEISKTSGTIAKILNQDADIQIGDFQDLFMDTRYYSPSKKQYSGEKKNLIIGNPPYFKRTGHGSNVDTHLKESQDYFVSKGLDMLEDGGLLIYVVNSGFLAKKGMSNFKAKKEIASKGTLIDAYRLPSGLFKNEGTGVATEIIVIKKKPGNVNDFTDDNFFNKNPNKLLYDDVKGEGQFRVYTGDEKQLDKIKADNFEEEVNFTPLVDVIKEEKKKEVGQAVKTPKTNNKEQVKKEKIDENRSKINGIETNNILLVKGKDIPKETQDLLDKTGFNLEVIGKKDIKKGEPVNYSNEGIIYDDFYFSGDIYLKLDELENNKEYIIDNFGEEQYLKQKKGLEEVKPKKILTKDIDFSYKNNNLMNITDGKIDIVSSFKKWIGNNNINFGYGISQYDVITEINGGRMSVERKKKIGQFLSEEIDKNLNKFKNEMETELKTKIEDYYNRKLNAYVETDYSKLPFINKDIAINFKGSKFTYSKVQENGIKRLIYKGTGLITYGVGVGKTHTLLGATKGLIDSGRIKRPLFIVPKSTLQKTWIGTIEKMYPGQNIVNLGGLTKPDIERLKKTYGNDSTKWIKDGDMVVITHEGINVLGMSVENIKKIEMRLTDILTIGSKEWKNIEKEEGKITGILEGTFKGASPDVTIEGLGIDHLSVDEVHNFRKVFGGARKKEDGNGIEEKNRFTQVLGGTPSQRAQKLFLLSSYIQDINNGRGVILASATPFENKATEIYNIISLIGYRRLKELGIENINDFYGMFANFTTELTKKATGDISATEVFYDFANKTELQKIIREFIDYQEDKYLVRPDKIVKTPYLEMSSEQYITLAKIQELARSKEDGALLKASSYGKMNSTSPYFIDEYYDGSQITPEVLVEGSPKLEFTYETIKELKNEHPDKGHFVYFGDVGAKYLEKYKQYFIEKGLYNDKEIGVIGGVTKDKDRELIKEKFNSGEIKVLIGGEPTTEGIDLQNNGIATYVLGLGWNPTQMTQVEGRVWRQGNKASKVSVVYPLVENSNDSIMFQKFKEKGGRIGNLFDYNEVSEKDTKLDYNEQLINLMTDPKDKVEIKMSIEKKNLENQKSTQEALKRDLKRGADNLKRDRGELERLNEAIKGREENIAKLKLEKKSIKDEDEIKSYESNIERRIGYLKDDKDYRKKLNFSIENTIGFLEGYGIKDIDNIDDKIKLVEEDIEKLTVKIDKLPEKSDELYKYFVDEKRKYDEKKLSFEDNIKDIKNDLKDIKYYTDEEIAEIRNKLIEADEKNK